MKTSYRFRTSAARCLVAIVVLTTVTAEARAEIFFGTLAANTGWGVGTFQQDPLTGSISNVQSFGGNNPLIFDPTNTSVTASLALGGQSQYSGPILDWATSYQSSISATVSNVTSNSFEFDVTGNALNDTYNQGSSALSTYADAGAQLAFYTDSAISLTLGLNVQTSIQGSNVYGNTNAQTGGDIQLFHTVGNNTFVSQLTASSTVVTDENARSTSNGSPSTTLAVLDFRQYILGHAPTIEQGVSTITLNLDPGWYSLNGNVSASTQFLSNFGAPGLEQYGSGFYNDPSINALSSSAPGVGVGVSADQSTVPEPSSLILTGLGGIGLAVGAFRRRRIAAAC